MFHAKLWEKEKIRKIYHLLQFASLCHYQRGEKSESLKCFFLSVHPYHLPDPELTNALRLMAAKNLEHIPALLCHIRLSAFNTT